METITIQQITYGILCDDRGDIVLMSDKQDVTIKGGYEALEELAVAKVDKYQDLNGELDYSKQQVDYQVDLMLKEFIMDNFLYGDVTIHDAEDSAIDEALAILSQTRLEKLKWSLALMQAKIDAPDADLVWLANRVDGAMKVKSDPALLPY